MEPEKGDFEIYESDFEKQLVKEVKEKNKRAENKLLNKYEPLVKSTSRRILYKYYSVSLEREDVDNVLRYYLIELTRIYDEDKHVAYQSYLKDFLYKRACNLCRGFSNKNHALVNFTNLLQEQEVKTRQNSLHDYSEWVYFALEREEIFTKIEAKVLKGYLEEKTVKEIANEMGISKQSVSRHQIIAKEKLQKLNTEEI